MTAHVSRIESATGPTPVVSGAKPVLDKSFFGTACAAGRLQRSGRKAGPLVPLDQVSLNRMILL